jgi:hypothetical protein
MFAVRNKKRRWPALAALLGMGAVGYTVGIWQHRPAELLAQPPAATASATPNPQTEYSQRVVAYIYGNIPITREDLGEYLIARYGPNTLELFVNRKIIELACQKANVSVTPEEVEAAVNEDLEQLKVDRATFVKQFLKQYNKTLYEWKEDVIKPKLLLSKLCGSQIKVEEEEIKRAFDVQYGEKVQCRMILWPKGQERTILLTGIYDKIRKSEAEFDSAARSQPLPDLAMHGGRINPISKPFDEGSLLEKVAFKLKPGEVSEIFEIKDQGSAVLRCEARIPPDATKKYETERAKLQKMVFNRKLEQTIPPVFAKLKAEANPTMVLKYGTSQQDVIKATEEELKLLNQPQAAAGKAEPLPAPTPGPGRR